jgi:hypothetical protein
MTSIWILLALSALSGFVAGSHFSWPALAVTSALLAPLAAVVLQRQDFAALPGISIIVACLAINQLVYLIAIPLKNDQNEGGTEDHLPQKELDDVPRDDRNDDIRHQHKRHQSAQFNPTRFAVLRQADLAP